MALLDVENLKTYFHTEYGLVKAADGVSFQVNQGEIIGLVGESGCGKSVSILSVMRLIPSPPGETVGGKVIFEGQNLLKYEPNGASNEGYPGQQDDDDIPGADDFTEPGFNHCAPVNGDAGAASGYG